MSKLWQSIRKPSTLIKSLFIAVGSLGAVDYVTYTYWEKERKRLTRITESFQNKYGINAQTEFLKSNCGLLVTPSLDNIHAFDQFKKMDDDYATNINFKALLDNNVDWHSTTLSLKNIPENLLSLIENYWDCMRKEPFVIKDKYYIYTLLPQNYIRDVADNDTTNVIFDDLTIDHVQDVLQLNNEKGDGLYVQKVIESDRVAIGAFDRNANKKLVGYSYVNLDDLCASKPVIDVKCKDNNDIALKLNQLVANQHFNQNYDHLNIAVDVEDDSFMNMCQNMGFQQLPHIYYWIESMQN